MECIGDVPAADITVVTDEADNCTVNPMVAFVSDVSDGNTCPEVITRTYSITDDCGNTITVTQTITVDDTTNPTASNPAPVTVECIGDVPAADITVVTDEADNCTVNPMVAFVSDVSDGNTCPEVITRTIPLLMIVGTALPLPKQLLLMIPQTQQLPTLLRLLWNVLAMCLLQILQWLPMKRIIVLSTQWWHLCRMCLMETHAPK